MTVYGAKTINTKAKTDATCNSGVNSFMAIPIEVIACDPFDLNRRQGENQ
jgi:hypothetical protein